MLNIEPSILYVELVTIQYGDTRLLSQVSNTPPETVEPWWYMKVSIQNLVQISCLWISMFRHTENFAVSDLIALYRSFGLSSTGFGDDSSEYEVASLHLYFSRNLPLVPQCWHSCDIPRCSRGRQLFQTEENSVLSAQILLCTDIFLRFLCYHHFLFQSDDTGGQTFGLLLNYRLISA